MEAYKQEFIEFMVDSKVLKFGDFTLKSGRKSPFFMNAGGYVTGTQLKKLGEYYAKAIYANYGLDFDVLFGPAYKGIPIAVVTAIAFHELYGKEIRYCSDRQCRIRFGSLRSVPSFRWSTGRCRLRGTGLHGQPAGHHPQGTCHHRPV